MTTISGCYYSTGFLCFKFCVQQTIAKIIKTMARLPKTDATMTTVSLLLKDSGAIGVLGSTYTFYTKPIYKF